MGYHEIDVVTRHQVHCKDCGYELEVHTAGEAEIYAREHIEEYIDGQGMPNYSHTLIITPVTMCGRQL